jgi:hypothetical protein
MWGILVAQNSTRVHQCGTYGVVVAWVVLGAVVQVEDDVCGFAVKLMTQGAIGCLVNIGVQEEGVALSMRLSSDTDIPVKSVRIVTEAFQLVGPTEPSTYRNQQRGLWVSQSRAISSNCSM